MPCLPQHLFECTHIHIEAGQPSHKDTCMCVYTSTCTRHVCAHKHTCTVYTSLYDVYKCTDLHNAQEQSHLFVICNAQEQSHLFVICMYYLPLHLLAMFLLPCLGLHLLHFNGVWLSAAHVQLVISHAEGQDTFVNAKSRGIEHKVLERTLSKHRVYMYTYIRPYVCSCTCTCSALVALP